MKIIIAGGTGQIGAILVRALSKRGDEIVVLSRQPGRTGRVRTVEWDGKTPGPWTNELEGADVVINLVGRSVNCRYGQKNRREIIRSRVDSVRAIGSAIRDAQRPPHVWLQAGTATIYSHRFDAPNDECGGIIGGSERDAPETWRFSIDVAKAWEAAACEFEHPARTRFVLLRSAMTMSPDAGGIFATLLHLVRLGLGGRAGDGKQFVSWIHEDDFVRVISVLIQDASFSGVVNVCSPNPLPNAEFMRALRSAWGIGVGLPASKWMLELGAFFMRTETELVLKSRRVIPSRLLQSGFKFRFRHWRGAAEDLCQKCRAAFAKQTAAQQL
jgi:uncharacterized protein